MKGKIFNAQEVQAIIAGNKTMFSEIRKKDGTIYNSCPFIDKLLSLCNSQTEIINEIKEELEKVRKINEALRENQKDASEIEKAVDEAKEEVWNNVAGIIKGKYWKHTKSDLEDLVCEVEELRDQNKDLLRQIENIE